MEQNLAFSIDDPDFRVFLPQEPEELMKARWTDFNIHDPGVTSLEAIIFAFEDLRYKYDLPIEDILQGPENNALSSWNMRKLFTQYAVSEHDYRRVVCSIRNIRNSVIVPLIRGKTYYNQQETVCLLDVMVTSNVDFNLKNKCQRKLLVNRALGSYFNREQGQKTFLKEQVVGIDVVVELIFKNGQDTVKNNELIRASIENYLMPSLEQVDFRKVKTSDYHITEVMTGPLDDENADSDAVIIETGSLQMTCFRNKIVVGSLYEVVQDLSFVASVISIGVKFADKPGPYENSVLLLGEHTFTRLSNLQVNKTAVTECGVVSERDDSIKLPGFISSNVVKGSFKKLGEFNSLQLSFPPNYKLGHYIVPPENKEKDPTSNFRTFLSFMDQVRGDIAAQMGNLAKVFSGFPLDDAETGSEDQAIATKNLNTSNFYKDLGIPNPIGMTEEDTDIFLEDRLNYLLALNGWSIVLEIPYLASYQNLIQIKQQYLDLLMERVKCDKHYNQELNRIFRATALVLLQKKIGIVLSTDVCEVRILEHCFLQPVATEELSLNFEATFFLFVSCDTIFDDDNFDLLDTYAKALITSFSPAHMVSHIVWRQKCEIEKFDEELGQAYPKEEIFYFNEQLSTGQLEAMKRLLHEWVLGPVKP
jgi:hypothetical protein